MVNGQERTATSIPTKKIILWIGMASMTMLFAGLTSAYIVRQAEGNWAKFDLPAFFSISTGALLVSSITMNRSVAAAKKGNISFLRSMLLITFLLGITFVFLQFAGWKELVTHNVVFAGKTSNPSGSFLYVLTGLHLSHLAGGMLALLYCIFDVTKNAKNFAAKNILSVELSAIFWHFLTGLWIYLFLFLLLVR